MKHSEKIGFIKDAVKIKVLKQSDIGQRQLFVKGKG